MRTHTVILEYCGGERTDRLYAQLSRSNTEYPIDVLDNASPRDQCHCITVPNATNSYIGGGIIDCIALAEGRGAQYLFLVMNDVEPVTEIEIAYFESLLDRHPDVIQAGCTVSPSSDKAKVYPWMTCRDGNAIRRVPLSDLLCCALRLDFIRRFDGFPMSKGGWGFDWELAYHAHFQRKTILVSDRHTISHSVRYQPEAGSDSEKSLEMHAIYNQRYENFIETVRGILNDFFTPPENERFAD
jgi:hypothetical protein